MRRRWNELPNGADYEPDKIKNDLVGPEVGYPLSAFEFNTNNF